MRGIVVMLLGMVALTSMAAAAEPVDLFAHGLDGWVDEGGSDLQANRSRMPVWTFTDGVVRCSGHGFGFLRHESTHADFRLELEYRFPKNGNSGVGIRTRPYTGLVETRPSQAAYEIQLLSDPGAAPSLTSGCSLYDHAPPKRNTSRAIGEWNMLVVECRGPRIRIIHNDVEVVDFDQSSSPAAKNKPLAGSVCLQNHGSVVEFRHVLLTDLSPPGDDGE